MREDEPLLYAKADRLVDGDEEAMLALTRLSVLSGLLVMMVISTPRFDAASSASIMSSVSTTYGF